MLEVSGAGKEFGNVVAVSDVSFVARPGEPLGLLGLNGAGKTTTLKMLVGIHSPTYGKISISGLEVNSKNSQDVKRLIGYLPDRPPLYLDMRVVEYLEHIAALRGLRRKEKRLAVSAVVERCRLDSVRNILCHQLSRGYAQRVALAQALVHDPQILIMDEPTIGLDPEQVLEIRDLLSEIGQKKTVIFSSHVLSEVQSVCSKVVLMHRGKSLEEVDILAIPEGKNLEQLFIERVALENNEITKHKVA